MNLNRKSDATDFKNTLQQLQNRLDSNRKWWTKYLFHFTDIQNAVKVLKSGSLLSRYQVLIADPDFEDSASPDVIENTQEKWKNYVRFYFRPRTPTLYHNEGFRPTSSQKYDAHCPLPIYFLFNFQSIITLPEAEFSARSLARSDAETYKNSQEFARLPFDDIYHDTWISQQNMNRVIGARHAEVIYPQRINLQFLEQICCRSQAEYETLRNLLSPQLWNEWKDKIRVLPHQNLFFKKWLYINQVTLTNEETIFKFNLPEKRSDYGPFSINMLITDDMTGRQLTRILDYEEIPRQQIRVGGLQKYGFDGYQIRCEINGDLAYLGRYQDSDIPF